MMNYSSRPPEEPAVHAQDLTVVRGSRTVLRGLGFTVPRGRITGLLGPSGCGKSTLMRAVVGTQAKVTGTLDVLGRPAGHPSLRTRIGYVTQAPSVYDDLTVRQNLDYFAAILDPGRPPPTAATTTSPAPSPTSTSPATPTPSPAPSPAASAAASPSPSPSSARPSCWSSTNPPSAWTPYSAATSGSSSTTSPPSAAPPSSSPPM